MELLENLNKLDGVEGFMEFEEEEEEETSSAAPTRTTSGRMAFGEEKKVEEEELFGAVEGESNAAACCCLFVCLFELFSLSMKYIFIYIYICEDLHIFTCFIWNTLSFSTSSVILMKHKQIWTQR